VTVIAALGLDGVRAPLAFPGATDAVAFQTYVNSVLVAELHAGDVVVFDNLSSHLASGVAAAIEQTGAESLPLPPYSSDYTPIEELWSKAKQFLHRVAAQSRTSLYNALGQALEHVTAQDIIGWFRLAGLCATHGQTALGSDVRSRG
jgi:transposase